MKAIVSSRKHLFKVERKLCGAPNVAVSWPEDKMSFQGSAEGRATETLIRGAPPALAYMRSPFLKPTELRGVHPLPQECFQCSHWSLKNWVLTATFSLVNSVTQVVGWNALGYKLYFTLPRGLLTIRIFLSYAL